MRNAFADEIATCAAGDPRLVLLSGDIGNRLFDPFKAVRPGRFFNCGVAEANMIGVAAGLALSGLRPVCYTIAAFMTYRCMEQIRVDLCYHRLPVVIVGTGSGLAYASLGATHHSCEEMGMLRLLPGMTVLAPADAMELRACIRLALAHDGPTYIRIGKKGEPVVHSRPPALRLGGSVVVREGRDICLLVAGVLLPAALAAADLLAVGGVAVEVVSCPSVKPLDESLLERVFGQFRVVATLEEHSILGGFGGAVAEWTSARPPGGSQLVRIATPDDFLHETSEQEHARERFGLAPVAIAERLRTAMRERAS